MIHCKNYSFSTEETNTAATAIIEIYIPVQGIYFNCSLQQGDGTITAPLGEVGKNKIQERFWPLLADMPTLSHWPDRSLPFDYAHSEVITYIRERFGLDMDLAIKVFRYASQKGVILFNRETKLWCGTKGGAR